MNADVCEARFPAMGTTAHVVVTGGRPQLVGDARDQLAELEAKWSRFRSDSELSRLNRLASRPVVVSALTFELIELACRAWHRTHGLFDPTILAALEHAGYDRDFAVLPADGAVMTREPPAAPGCAGIELDPLVGSVFLPAGTALDLGGIAKGFAADVVAQQLVEAGASGACVNVGGDLRVVGQPPHGDAWVVSIDAEVSNAAPLRPLMLVEGAIATSSRTRRVWTRGDRIFHHLIDPRTGASAEIDFISATIVAGRAVDAEPLAKATLLDPDSAEKFVAAHQAYGFLVRQTGDCVLLGEIDRFFAAAPR